MHIRGVWYVRQTISKLFLSKNFWNFYLPFSVTCHSISFNKGLTPDWACKLHTKTRENLDWSMLSEKKNMIIGICFKNGNRWYWHFFSKKGKWQTLSSNLFLFFQRGNWQLPASNDLSAMMHYVRHYINNL